MPTAQTYLAYAPENEAAVEQLAIRLQTDARLAFWFRPWHSVPGRPIPEQMQAALLQAQSCVVFLGGKASGIEGWQNLAMSAAIQNRVANDPSYRIIPVFLPGPVRPTPRDSPFLLLNEAVEFESFDDERAFRRLLAGILGVPPIRIDGYLQIQTDRARQAPPQSGRFEQGHALVIGIAQYAHINHLPEAVWNDASDLHTLLTDPRICGYPQPQVELLSNADATSYNIRTALARLADRTVSEDTALIFFSGHGAHTAAQPDRHYLLPYDCHATNLPATAIPNDEMTELLGNIPAGRLLVLLDCCHSSGVADPKQLLADLQQLGDVIPSLSEAYYAGLARGAGRVVMASSRPEELSWVMRDMRNSLFTHYLLDALRGNSRTLGDGYVRVFDLFRHVAAHVPRRADQHPMIKVTAMDEDFPIALTNSSEGTS